MPQSVRRGAAPPNREPEWPGGYMAVLREAGAQEKAIPCCVGWVQCLLASHPGRRRPDLGRGGIEAFLAEAARHPGMSNWQVQQARDALELYYEQFRGIALAPRPDGSESARSSSPASPRPNREPPEERPTPKLASRPLPPSSPRGSDPAGAVSAADVATVRETNADYDTVVREDVKGPSVGVRAVPLSRLAACGSRGGSLDLERAEALTTSLARAPSQARSEAFRPFPPRGP